nr:ORF2 [Synechococcus elongatus PCC 6301]
MLRAFPSDVANTAAQKNAGTDANADQIWIIEQWSDRSRIGIDSVAQIRQQRPEVGVERLVATIHANDEVLIEIAGIEEIELVDAVAIDRGFKAAARIAICSLPDRPQSHFLTRDQIGNHLPAAILCFRILTFFTGTQK